MCPCAAVRRVGRGDDSGLLPGVDGWEQGATTRSVSGRALHRTDGPVCPGQATSDAARRRAGIARPRCVRRASRRKPAGRYPEVLPRMGLPAPFPPGAGATLTRVHLSSYPHESGTPRPQNFSPPRSWTGNSTRGRVYVRSPYFPDFMSARAVTYGCVLLSQLLIPPSVRY